MAGLSIGFSNVAMTLLRHRTMVTGFSTCIEKDWNRGQAWKGQQPLIILSVFQEWLNHS